MFIRKIEETIREYNMILAGDKVVAGVSGGADSVCLFCVLDKLREKMGFSLYAIHVHHSIRGEEADRDAEFVRKLCEEHGIPCRICKYDVPAFAAENRLSVEEAGRMLRREAFAEYANEVGHAKIALAHHRNDVAETVLFNLARGSGLAGLSSLKPVRESYIRPLLFVGREEIIGWLSENNIRFCTDSTNADSAYSRNFIRNRILPELTEGVNRQSVRHLCEVSTEAGEAEEFLTECAKKCFNIYAKRISREEIFLSCRMFQDENPYIVARTAKLALCSLAGTAKDIGRVHIKAVCALAGSENGKRADLPYGICAESVYGDIRLVRTGGKDEESRENGQTFHGCADSALVKRWEGETARKSGPTFHGFTDSALVKQQEGDVSVKSGLAFRNRADGVFVKHREDAMHQESQLSKETALELGRAKMFGGVQIFAELQDVCDEYGGNYDDGRASNARPIEKMGKNGACKRESIGEFADTYSGKAQNSCTKKFDYDRINGMLKIRYRMAGDYLVIHPDGRKKSLSDYFTDRKVPRHLRDAIPLLACGSEILWVIGYRTGESCRIREGTRRVLSVTASSEMA
ncbi:MAG: tRNA lysidine(34) synthetase TilS [Lachnospiraceae bacterium]|nr:tRNA lysidine(34) synthetase TilS [Lachnospiraceae bacterium]